MLRASICFGGGIGGHAAKLEGTGEESRSLRLVDFDELSFGEVLAFAFEVEDLSADELAGATGVGEFEEVVFGGVSLCGWGLGEDGEGLGEEGVATEDGHAFAVNFMTSGSASAEIIIVHAREVIVDEGVGVHDLDGAGGRESIGGVATASFVCGEGEDGAESLAAGEDGIPHRLVNGARLSGFPG